ncbi:transglycosylase SLT domain-containing protein [Kitasatospora sp. NPDC096147]|uniref:transglycosylase SLT domain-containing protein n=1 Tax=Kitasatospora sp. NPDC096147 TaxID=3364093 RepID=UPI00380724BC
MATTRGPIKVGSGYIEITTNLSKEAIGKFRAEVAREMEKVGDQAAKQMSAAATKGMAALPAAAAKAAAKAKQAVEGEAKDSAETLERIERELTRQFGTEAVRRFQEARKLEERKQQLTEETSSVTRAALRATVAQETAAAQTRSRQTQQEERERLAALRRVAAEQVRTAEAEARQRQRAVEDSARMDREIAAAYERMQRERVAAAARAEQQIREQMQTSQAARRADLREQLAANQAGTRDLRRQLADYRAELGTIESSQGITLSKIQTGWKGVGTSIETLGTNATEAGNIITNRLLLPLTTVAGVLTGIGVQSGDTRLLGQLGLTAAGVSTKTSSEQMSRVQKYAIETPYSIDSMHTYQMKYIRSLAGGDQDWFSDNTGKRTGAANKAAMKATDLIMAVGDSMARAGNITSAEFDRAMYALDKIMDRDRAPTRNITQLVQATGIPAAELANMLGFKSSEELWKTVGTPAAKGGGVTGAEIADSLLEYWKPNYNKKPGEKLSKEEGSEGYAAKMTSATISGRLQQMKERGQYELGSMFVQEGKDGQYAYTKLGQSIIGQDGILDDLQDLGKSALRHLPGALQAFVDEVERVTGWAKRAAAFMEKHPQIKEAALKIAQIAVVAAPLLIGLGLLTTVVGKVTKILSLGLVPIRAAVGAAALAGRGVRGGVRTLRQTGAGVAGRVRGDSYFDTYRDRRIALRGGDTRGPIRRSVDSLRGGNSQSGQIRTQMRDVQQQIRAAEDQAEELRRALREVAGTSMRQLTNELGGTGSVSSAARQARTEIRQVQTQGIESLNRSSLSAVQGEVNDLRQGADRLIAAIKDAQREVGQLDSKSLSAVQGEVTDLRQAAERLVAVLQDAQREAGQLNAKTLKALKGELDQAHGAADRLYEKIGQGTGATSVAGRIGLLNSRTLNGLRAELDQVHAAANRAHDMVGQGTGAGSLAGRVGLLNSRSLSGLVNEFNQVRDSADRAYNIVGMGTGAGSLAGRIGLLNDRTLNDLVNRVDKLTEALEKAQRHANSLDNAIDNVSRRAPGGNSSPGPSKPKKYNSGGVLPGYAPGVDNIPALLSPGEAILRPEVTATLGPSLIHHWNGLARAGRLSRFASGGIAGRLGLDQIRDAIRLQNVWPIASAATSTMTFDESSNALGGPVQGGMLGSGTTTSRWLGSRTADRFRDMFDFVTRDSFDLMRRVPSGIGQALGIAGGAIAPVLGEYFWNDVWKGSGNIVQRGERFLGNTFSMKTLKSGGSNLLGGIWDSVKSIAGSAGDLITDPLGTAKGALEGIWEIAKSEIDQLTDMVTAFKSIVDSPSSYAGQVLSDMMDTAKESLPNTEGLFDFSDGQQVNASRPAFDFSDAIARLGPMSEAVTRWTPLVQRVLGELGLAQDYTGLVLHRIGVESGGNPTAVNLWDSNALNPAIGPSRGLMQTIKATFDAYAGPYHGRGITDPLASIYAGLNYATNRYGSRWPDALSGTRGYWTGTTSASPGLALVGERGREIVDFRGGERVYNNRDTEALLSGRKYEIHVHEAKHEDTTQATIRALQYMEALHGI